MGKNLKSLIVLFKAHSSIEKNIKYSIVDSGLNLNEFTTMEALYTKGTLSTQAIIDTILIPNSSMTYVLENLLKKGYINRKKDKDDKRVSIISLTKNGRDTFEQVYKKHFKHMREVFDSLSSDEEEVLQELLKRVGKKAEEKLKWDML